MSKPTKHRSWFEIEGGVTSPLKFKASALRAGIKPQSQKPDLALLFSDVPALAAGVFTTNRVIAAPVIVSRQHLSRMHGRVQAIIVNSGNANACTGKTGLKASRQMAIQTSAMLGIPSQATLVASTGVIGQPLPLKKITDALPTLVSSLSEKAGPDFAAAIMTTDTRMKTCAVRSQWAGRSVTIAGAAKGSGMIQPRLATMLAFLTTDANISLPLLRSALRDAVAVSFNRLTVDGDTSTNDSVFVLANGASNLPVLSRRGKDFDHFKEGLTRVCISLAKQIARDGEGAGRLIEVVVQGARTDREADCVARAVANSPLVKTAMAGADANWGRIICAAGYSGARIDPDRVDIRLNGTLVCRGGRPFAFDEASIKKLLESPEIRIALSLHQGRCSGTIWTCDLTEDYIRINASYRT